MTRDELSAYEDRIAGLITDSRAANVDPGSLTISVRGEAFLELSDAAPVGQPVTNDGGRIYRSRAHLYFRSRFVKKDIRINAASALQHPRTIIVFGQSGKGRWTAYDHDGDDIGHGINLHDARRVSADDLRILLDKLEWVDAAEPVVRPPQAVDDTDPRT